MSNLAAAARSLSLAECGWAPYRGRDPLSPSSSQGRQTYVRIRSSQRANVQRTWTEALAHHHLSSDRHQQGTSNTAFHLSAQGGRASSIACVSMCNGVCFCTVVGTSQVPMFSVNSRSLLLTVTPQSRSSRCTKLKPCVFPSLSKQAESRLLNVRSEACVCAPALRILSVLWPRILSR